MANWRWPGRWARRIAVLSVLGLSTLAPPLVSTARAEKGKAVKDAFKRFGRAVKDTAKAGAKKVKKAVKGGKSKSK